MYYLNNYVYLQVGMGDIEILCTIILKQEYHDYTDYCLHSIFTEN